MWTKLALVACLLAASMQAYSAKGNEHVLFEKFDYTNQTMSDLGFPEDNYSPSNFYTVSIVEKQRVVGHSDKECFGTGYKDRVRQDCRSTVVPLHDQRIQKLQDRR